MKFNNLSTALALLLSASMSLSAQPLVFEDIGATLGSDYTLLESTPDGKFIYAINGANGDVEIYQVSESGGLVSPQSLNVANVTGGQAFSFSSDGTLSIVGTSNASTAEGVYAFSRDAGAGFVAVPFKLNGTGPDEDGLLDDVDVRAVSISPDGKSIYIAGVDSTNGGDSPAGSAGAEGVIAVIEGVEYVAPTHVSYTNISFHEQNDTTGMTVSVPELVVPSALVATSDSVYALSNGVAANEDAFLHFTRDANTGKLTFSRSVSQANGVAELANPSQLLVQGEGANTRVFVGANPVAGNGFILQFNRASVALSPSLARVYGNDTAPAINNLGFINDLVSTESLIYVISSNAPGSGRITPLLLDEDVLQQVENQQPIVNNSTNGLANAALAVLANDNQHLYVTSSVASAGLSRWGRSSNLSLVVTAQNRQQIQPGQVAGFTIVATNNGPADAPGVELVLIPSHTVTSLGGANSNLCETNTTSSGTRIVCSSDLLSVSDTITVELAMRPTAITRASVNGSVRSSNAGDTSSASSDSDVVPVGSFKNGSLAIGFGLHLVLMLLYILRFQKRSVMPTS